MRWLICHLHRKQKRTDESGSEGLLRQGGAVRADSDERFPVIFKPPSRA